MTAIRDLDEARRVLLDDSLRGLELVRREAGPVIDVGSGGGAPGIPLALALPEREFVLLEAQERKCVFLRDHAPPNARVVWGRAEDQPIDWAGCALAKALAPPPVAVEWCLPLVRPRGAAVLWIGPTAEADRIQRAADQLAAEVERAPEGFVVLRKTGATPAGFPRRSGVARKRPLA
ncbi:MAG: 16S rRNA (guanine(527)-N(7))-methyltransferase RsmG [Gaiellaceae bacterium]